MLVIKALLIFSRGAAMHRVLAIATALVLMLTDISIGQVSPSIDTAKIQSQPVKLAEIVEFARHANDREVFDSAHLAALLDRLSEILAKESQTAWKLPVRFGDVTEEPKRNSDSNRLITMESGKVDKATRSIVIVTGSVEVALAEDCIIIAGGSARVSQCKNSLVIAGHDVKVSVNAGSSCYLSGNRLHISLRSTGTALCGAHNQLITAPTSNYVYINRDAPKLLRPLPGGPVKELLPSTSFQTDQIVLEVPPLKDQLSQLLSVTETGHNYIVIRRARDGGEYVIRYRKPICAPNGTPLEELVGWELESVTDWEFIFRNGDERSIVFRR
jgi:hypothetical protein